MMAKDDISNEILNHSPSVNSLVIILKRMKKEGHLNEVVQECMRSLRIYPDDIRLRILLAESYAEIGFISLAEAQLEKVASMIDTLAPAYRLLSEIYRKQQRHAEAADMLRRYLAHYPGQPEALESLEEMETALMPDEGQVEMEAPSEDVAPSDDEPGDALVDFATPTIAELYYTQGQTGAAINTYEKVVRSNPDDHDSIRRLNELKGMAAGLPGTEEKAAGDLRAGKERLIMTLER